MRKDKSWLVKEIQDLEIETSQNYPHDEMIEKEIVLGLMNQLDGSVKPVIPRFVAEQLEYWERNEMNVLWQFYLKEIPSSILWWLEGKEQNYDKLINAIKYGYEIEKVPWWIVKNKFGSYVLVDKYYQQWIFVEESSEATTFTDKSKAELVAVLIDGEVEARG